MSSSYPFYVLVHEGDLAVLSCQVLIFGIGKDLRERTFCFQVLGFIDIVILPFLRSVV